MQHNQYPGCDDGDGEDYDDDDIFIDPIFTMMMMIIMQNQLHILCWLRQGKVRLRYAGSRGVQCLIGLTSKTGPEQENDDHDDLDIDSNQNVFKLLAVTGALYMMMRQL